MGPSTQRNSISPLKPYLSKRMSSTSEYDWLQAGKPTRPLSLLLKILLINFCFILYLYYIFLTTPVLSNNLENIPEKVPFFFCSSSYPLFYNNLLEFLFF